MWSLHCSKPLFPFSTLGIVIALTEQLLGLVSTQPHGEGGAEGRWWRGKLEEQRWWPGVFWLMTSLPLDEHSVVSGGRVFRWRRVKRKKSGRAAGREGNLGGKGHRRLEGVSFEVLSWVGCELAFISPLSV